jgi:fructose-1,6-bisphosphatase
VCFITVDPQIKVPETLIFNSILIQLIAQEDFGTSVSTLMEETGEISETSVCILTLTRLIVGEDIGTVDKMLQCSEW